MFTGRDSGLMFKFFKKHPPKEGEGRERLKKELFDYRKVWQSILLHICLYDLSKLCSHVGFYDR